MVIQNNNKISLPLNDAEPKKGAGVSVPNAKDGRVSKNIWSPTMDCAVQQEMGSSAVYTEAEARQLNYETADLPNTGSMSPADFISQCMTGEDAQALSEEETPLEEYTSSQLERAVSRVREQRSQAKQAVEDQVAKEREEREALEKTAIQNAVGADFPPEIRQRLEDSGLPVTEETAAKLTNAARLAADRQDMTRAAVKYFIGNELPVTPENISAGVHGGAAQSAERKTENESGFDAVRAQAESILQEGGATPDAKSMETAEWLYKNGLPVTAGNVEIYEQLEEIKELDADTLLARIADALADGVAAEKADLTLPSREESAGMVKEFLNTDEEAFVRAYPAEVDRIRAMRQMEEIRLTMTAEAARKMAAKGIKLDVSNLEQIVTELRVQEQQAKESWLLETGVPVTEQNAEILPDTIQAAKNILDAPVGLLAEAIRAEDTQTLRELSESAVALKAQYDKMEQTYEAVGTEVRRDLGDSIHKAFGNVNDILEDLGMDVTAMNQRAVRILAYNQMELSEENIVRMKEYDNKVTTLMDNLKPYVVAEMVKEEINPLELTIDELNDAVEEIRENTAGEDMSFRKFLWRMDHQGALSEEERQSMIGVYRLLDKIEKSDGAVIGQVVKEGRELSLASLLSATRTRRAEGMDVEISDEFGGLEKAVTRGTSIDDQIRTAYQTSVAGKLRRNISPRALRELGKDAMDLSLEQLLETVQEMDAGNEDLQPYYRQMAEEIAGAMSGSEGEMIEFLESLDMPDTVLNRMLAMGFAADGLREYLGLWKKEESASLANIFDDPEKLDAFYEETDQAHEKELAAGRESDDISYDSVVSLARMAGSISFYRNLRSHHSYEVPIVTERGVTSCHVTLRSAERQKGTVEISLNSEELGRVQATFRVSGTHVKGFVTAERQDSIEACQRILDRFEMDLEENGFTMDSDSLVQGERRSLHEKYDRPQDAGNKDLYLVAKCFIVNVNGKGDEK